MTHFAHQPEDAEVVITIRGKRYHAQRKTFRGDGLPTILCRQMTWLLKTTPGELKAAHGQNTFLPCVDCFSQRSRRRF